MFATAITGYEPEDRALLRRSARDWLARARPLPAIRPLREERRFDRGFLARLGEMGWLGGFCAGEDGPGVPELVALHRELGRHVLPEPVVLSAVLCARLLQGGGGAVSDLWEEICAGRAVATLAFAGTGGGVTSADLSLRAEPAGTGWRLSGTAALVPWAEAADQLLVVARSPRGALLALCPPGTAEVQTRRQVDGGLSADLTFARAELAALQVIAEGPEVLTLLDEALDLARLAVSAELLGAAERLFEITLGYLRSREQFGRPIGANQALQFAAVDLFIGIELANSVLSAAAAGFDGAERARLAARCKSRCGDVAFAMAQQAIQMHGAIGYTDACDVSLFVKRIMAQMAWLGTPARHRDRLAGELAAGEAVQ